MPNDNLCHLKHDPEEPCDLCWEIEMAVIFWGPMGQSE